jgi:membrane protein implicated in regulation of membrane protease activity
VTKRRLRWDPPPEETTLKRPYRDTALVYGGMALVVVLLGVATGAGVVRTLLIACAFFVIATLWSWRNWRKRERERRQRERANP